MTHDLGALWFAACSLAVLSLFMALEAHEALRAGRRARKRQVEVAAKWEPVLLEAQVFMRVPENLHAIAPSEVPALVALWLQHLRQASLNAAPCLKQMAQRAQLEPHLHRLLRRGALDQQVLAAEALGHLEAKDASPSLLKLLRGRVLPLSSTAGVALVRVAPTLFLREVLSSAIRKGWPISAVAKTIELAPELSDGVLPALLSENHAKRAGRVLEVWFRVSPAAALVFARQTLSDMSAEGWLLCSSLRVLQNPHDVALVRAHLQHPRWAVRVQAVNAMGRLGLSSDIAQLAKAHADPNWWIRKRSADSLAAAPQLSADQKARLLAPFQALAAQESLP